MAVARRRAALAAMMMAGIAGMLVLTVAGGAEAHGRGGRGSVYFSFGPPYDYPPYYGPRHYGPRYYGPRYYYPPPPVVYAPPPVVYAPPAPTVTPAPTIDRSNCREYQAPATVGGEPGNTYGTACLQPDGSWRIVQ